ncbi:MAG: 6-oxocyclohex-1-ene-1-carbonyl-CoA hydratase [Deltaproteobacteria bacterium]|nr:6-oxocyclohex-1-ene-1-carbonyl-CoA hydratase [Deltaproteobacteria bacterium]
MTTLNDHNLIADPVFDQIRYETRPVYDTKGAAVPDLHAVWIALDNEKQLNSYTTEAVKQVILAFRKASCDRAAVAVVFTAFGHKAFCTGGNTAEYSTYYAHRPLEYLQYMRLFNDMVTSILHCDKPVICRVNGMRIGGGQEIGMACDFSVAGDHARFGQAGPVHGSAPDGGSTDFLDQFVGFAKAVESLVLCEPWSAHKAVRLGAINDLVPVHKTADGQFIANPLAVTDRYLDDQGRIVHGEWKTGAEAEAAKKLAAACTIDLSLLDAAVDKLVTRLMNTFPDCTRKTLESVRKKKLQHWYQNGESNRSWLANNMATEAAAGFPAFHFGDRAEREIDFVLLRQRLAAGARFDEALIAAVLKPSARAGRAAYRGAND